MYELKGKATVINETQQVSDAFKKREFVVTDNSGKYPQTILFQAVQERCDLLNGVNVGDEINVTFFLRGREWTNPKTGEVRFFNSLDAWKIEKTSAEATNETIIDDDLAF